ncbi:MAG TPA: tetratricopeptide repeat protein, partial [bacterium]
ALSGLALVLLARDSPDAAQMIGEAALALLAGEADRGARAHAFMVLGTIHHRRGRARQAKAAFQEGLALFVALNVRGMPAMPARSWRSWPSKMEIRRRRAGT